MDITGFPDPSRHLPRMSNPNRIRTWRVKPTQGSSLPAGCAIGQTRLGKALAHAASMGAGGDGSRNGARPGGAWGTVGSVKGTVSRRGSPRSPASLRHDSRRVSCHREKRSLVSYRCADRWSARAPGCVAGRHRI